MITSLQNENVKRWKKLGKKKNRLASHTFLIEGFHLVEEAHASEWRVLEIIIQEGIEIPAELDDYSSSTVSSAVMEHITDTKTPQGIAAVVQMDRYEWDSFQNLLVVDSLQDPGNLGTIIRTADASGFDAILLGNDSVDLYNQKTIRATQGSIFHIPIFHADLPSRIPLLKQEGYRMWVSAVTSAVSYKTITPEKKTALVIGNEGAGVSEEVFALADYVVKIPIYGRAESLNVSVAAGILMYYIVR